MVRLLTGSLSALSTVLSGYGDGWWESTREAEF